MKIDDFTLFTAAAAWLTPPADAPWKWDEECETITWQDGATVVFREELEQIMERFPSTLLPKAGALVLLLAACRGKIPEASILPTHLGPVVEGLRRISSLSPPLVQGVANRAALITHLLDRTPVQSKTSIQTIRDVLRGGQPFSELLERDAHTSFAEDAAVLLHPLKNMDVAALELLLRTGMPELPAAAGELEFPQASQMGVFLDQLLADPELAALAKVTRQVMAAVSLPEALSRANDEALGGYSDLGNRGPLHRLLLSELAHDNDTLCIRIALNEALYLRREPAADNPPSRLVILLDSGVRMWGLPRAFSTAVALAFLAKSGKHRRPEVYRATGAKFTTAPLWTKSGLLEHLEVMETTIHSMEAIHTLVTQLNEKPGPPVEIIAITHRITMQESTFLRDLRSLDFKGAADFYATGVDRDGNLSFSILGAHGMKLLKEARINLSDLFSVHAKSSAAILRDASFTRPAIFQEDPFPFLLFPDASIEIGCPLDGEHGGICLTENGGLWHWGQSKQGALRLSSAPMRGKTVDFFCSESRDIWFTIKFITNDSCLEIVTWKPDAGTGTDAMGFHSVPGFRQAPKHVFVRGGYLYLVMTDMTLVVLSADTLQRVGEGKLPDGCRLIGTRFITRESRSKVHDYGAFFWNSSGLHVAWEKFPGIPGGSLSAEPMLVFDRAGSKSPWVVNENGRIYAISDPLLHFVSRPGKVLQAQASHSGHRVWVKYGDRPMVVDIDAKQFVPAFNADVAKLLGGQAEPHQWSVRSKFSHVGLCQSGQIALRSQKGDWLKIELNGDHFEYIRTKAGNRNATLEGPKEWAITHPTHFGKSQKEPKHFTELRTVEWSGGNRVFLDARGLLHLQSADMSIPEVSFVLAESKSIPAWSSDGRKVGPSYFIGQHKSLPDDAATIDAHVRRFVSAILQ